MELTIIKPTVIRRGISAKPLSTGFVGVDLGYEADPIAFTPEVIAEESAGMGGRDSWRWRKEYERDFAAQAGRPVFEGNWLDAQRVHQINPILTLAWDPKGGDTPEKRLFEHPEGEVRIFRHPTEQPEDMPADTLRVKRACGIGIDVGEGVGQSDSTIQVFFADNREQAAEFASNSIRPTDLGRLAVDLARYYNDALICCVRKMHGITTLRAILDECQYPHVWRTKVTDRTTEFSAKNYGWPGGESSSPYLFGKWIDAMQRDEVILRSLLTIEQHRQYIYDERGRITHQQLVDVPVEVRERHGDLVVACALAYRACIDLPKFRDVVKRPVPGIRTWKGRKEIQKERKADDHAWT